MADTWITDIGHFLNEKGELPKKMSGHARSLTMYFGKIIEAASKQGNFGNEARTDIPCRRKPGNRKCGAAITASVQADSSIHWRCPACGDNGIISGWRDTAWDMRLKLGNPKDGRPKDIKDAKNYHTSTISATPGTMKLSWKRCLKKTRS